MVTICAWCDRLMAVDEPAEKVLVSHGICEACASRLDWRGSPTLVVSRRHASLVPVLAQLLRGHPHIHVIVDRRNAERRQAEKLDIAFERRERAERRQPGNPMVLV